MADWISDSNEAFSLKLQRDPASSSVLTSDAELETIQAFHPTFTYPIFGEEQKIFGYRGLDIQLLMTSGSLFQCLQVSQEAKIDSEATPADDIEGALKAHLAPDYTTSLSTFQTRLAQDATSFRPFGRKIGSYTRPSGVKEAASKGKGKGKASNESNSKKRALEGDEEEEEGDVVFEMWKTSWKDEGFLDYHRRMQFFILLYIEGGTFLVEDEDCWEFVILYEKRRLPSSSPNKRQAPSSPSSSTPSSTTEPSPSAEKEYSYHFVGYTTLYPFYNFPDKVRTRLSQFVILPPYQDQGHGSALYSTVYSTLILPDPRIVELTIEDPSEAFEDLRDVCDLRTIHRQILLSTAKGNSSTSAEEGEGWENALEGDAVLKGGKGWVVAELRAWGEKRRREGKFAGRQFSRLLEMLLLQYLDEDDKVAVKGYRLYVKERLYRFNFEILSQLKPKERKEKLEETFKAVKEDYERILERARLD
ncbi:acyl-CoA N-acyltransferase [Mrakia frigida]|uniref:histone acetyltransferase catalytic subunit HAT1 n=1 Tax=Mrakia frigida TaxID=29902 RepID=UPI003FCC0BAF